MPQPTIDELDAHARALRLHVVTMIQKVRTGYLLQGLGAADIFAALYFRELRLRPDDPNWAGRDRCLLSTAHNTAILYATFAERGLIPLSALDSYTVDGSVLEVNASERMGSLIEATCGSLGQGLSVAVGLALANRRHGSDSRTYVILGDGELQEGQVWEAALSAGGFGLDNLVLIIDRNYLQVEGHTDRVVPLEPIGDKFSAFNWRVIDIDGNDMAAIVDALDEARNPVGRPTVIIARTTPGAKIPFLEGRMNHVAYLGPDEAGRARSVLEAAA